MKIYTGTCAGEKFKKLKGYGLGVMISPSPSFEPREPFSEVSCAFDNGAFQAFERGYPFRRKAFWETLDKCYLLGIDLDFIVCPDIVGGGRKSLEFSIGWSEKLIGTPNLALVVQDDNKTIEQGVCKKQDMTPEMLGRYDLSMFSHIFVGGSVLWKWNTAEEWVKFAHDRKKKVHVGRCGQLRYMKLCDHIGVDSIDSTSIARNDSWHLIDEYRNKQYLFVGAKVGVSSDLLP